MLPYQPEPLEKLQARFADALTPIYTVQQLMQDMKRDPLARPGMRHKHVFDFEDGLRLIASVERDDRVSALLTAPYLHVSFSTHSQKNWPSAAHVTAWLQERTVMLSRGRLPPPKIEQTPRGIVHFFYEACDILQRLDPAERERVQSGWLGRGKVT